MSCSEDDCRILGHHFGIAGSCPEQPTQSHHQRRAGTKTCLSLERSALVRKEIAIDVTRKGEAPSPDTLSLWMFRVLPTSSSLPAVLLRPTNRIKNRRVFILIWKLTMAVDFVRNCLKIVPRFVKLPTFMRHVSCVSKGEPHLLFPQDCCRPEFISQSRLPPSEP